MKNDAIIFDIDGTLWDSRAAVAKGWNKGLVDLKLAERVTVQGIESVMGNPVEKCVDILLPGLRSARPELLEILGRFEFDAIETDGGLFYDGVSSGIEKLAGIYKIFLVSNCQDWYMHSFIKAAGIGRILAGFDCHGLSGLQKSAMLVKMKNDYRLINPVYIGDTAGDETATLAAGMEFAHAAYGFGSVVNKTLFFASFPALVDYFLGRAAAGPKTI